MCIKSPPSMYEKLTGMVAHISPRPLRSYAPTEPLGFLVAFVEFKTSTAMSSLKQALSMTSIQDLLKMIKYSNHVYIAEPPERFANHALFSTEHVRHINSSSITQTIALYHIPLTFN